MIGITGYGAYIPRRRLVRQVVAEAHAWSHPALRALAKGERSMCNWDEDAITMAVGAARDARSDPQTAKLEPHTLLLATTTAPFLDRLNAGLVRAALRLEGHVHCVDVTSSQKAGTSALALGLDVVAGRQTGTSPQDASNSVLCVAADRRRARAASPQELQFGDAAAALFLGSERVVARLLGKCSEAVDFVDHHRGAEREFDYYWEERWIRDEGFLKIVPPLLQEVLKSANVKAADIDHFVMPTVFPAVTRGMVKQIGLRPEAARDTLATSCGESGAAHALLMLVDALQEAKPGEKILVANFGSGCDVLLFEVTEAIAEVQGPRGVKSHLAARLEETNYQKFLAFNRLLTKEYGIRAEADMPTPMSALYRNKEMVFGLEGGLCRKCQTPQFPRSQVCVHCGAVGTQDPLSFADRPAHVMSWTADYLTFTLDPPGYYGMVEFDAGGRFMADFTDVAEGELDVGLPVSMVFRVKNVDGRRGFTRYFWKAVPVAPAA